MAAEQPRSNVEAGDLWVRVCRANISRSTFQDSVQTHQKWMISVFKLTGFKLIALEPDSATSSRSAGGRGGGTGHR